MTENARTGIFLAVAAALLLSLFHYFAALEPTSVAVYAGVVLTLGGLICVVKPIRLLGIRTRRAAAIAGAAGILLVLAALNWPVGTSRVAQRTAALDGFMPEYHFYELHEVRVHATPEVAAAALRRVTFGDIGVYSGLMRIRAAASGRFRAASPQSEVNVLQALARPGSGFVPLHDDGREIVMGMAGQPWSGGRVPSVRTPEDYEAFHRPESVKIAFNLAVRDEGGGWSRITTETRIRATDDAAQRIMARYWRTIYPGTGMIRRMWLNAARHRAENGR